VDIRTIPRPRHNPQFKGDTLLQIPVGPWRKVPAHEGARRPKEAEEGFDVVAVFMFIAFGVLNPPPHTTERAEACGSGAAGLISFAYTASRALVETNSHHAARWARENIVEPIASLLVMANEDLRKRSLDEIAAVARRVKTMAETILKALGD
jgi:hypothetical protein